MNIYPDTISVYHDYPGKHIHLNPASPWRQKTERKGKVDVKVSWLRDNHITLRVYERMFGKGRLFITCNPNKVVHGSNYWYLDSSEVPAFLSILQETLQKHIVRPVDIDPLVFQLSRFDLFYMHPTPPELKALVIEALSRMGIGRFKLSHFENTHYLSCTPLFEKDEEGRTRLASVVIRIYCKDLERFCREYPEAVDQDFRHHAYKEWIPPNYVRVEASLMRDRIVDRLGSGDPTDTSSTTLGALLLNPKLQAEILDERFESLGFYNRVLSRSNYRKEVKALAKTDKTYDKAREAAKQKRRDRNPKITKGVKELLDSNRISIITTLEHDLPPIDRIALLAQNATYVEVPDQQGFIDIVIPVATSSS